MNFEYREQIIALAFAIFLFSIQTHAQINVALQLTHPPCGGFSTGSILALPIGGTSPYTYEWSNGSSNNPITFIPAGTYTVTVTDVNGTTGMASGTIVEPDPLNVQIVVTDCGVPGEMEGVVSGGIPPYEYEWSNGEITTIISNLMPDPYCLTITDLNSCAYQLCESIGNPMSIDVTTYPAICGTGEGGSAKVDVVGGVLPYSFLWSNGEKTDSVSNLPPGIYTVTVTSENDCFETQSGEVEFVPGSYPIDFDVVHPDCTAPNTGQLTAIPTQGVPPYQYEWNNGDTSQTITNLMAGVYKVTITDFIGCISRDSAILDIPNTIQIDLDSLVNPTCHLSSDGYLEASATNGAEPYIFVWSTGDSTQFIDTLTAGWFYLTVTDQLNCMTVDSFELEDPDSLFVNLEIMHPSYCGANDGSIIATPSDSSIAAYSYEWNTSILDTLNFIENLEEGIYSVTITSPEGCQAKAKDTLIAITILDVSIAGTDLICYNENNGSLTANTSQGTPPYVYQWSNGGTTKTISNLTQGDYFVTVTSDEGCVGIDSATIIQNPEIIINGTINHVACFGQSNGSINISVGGGSPPLNISWPNGSNSTILNNLQAGTYAVTVTDGNNCTKSASFQVLQPPKLEITFSSSVGSCNNNGYSTAIVSGGIPPYQYLWSTGETDDTIDGVPPGTYNVTISDGNGCVKAGSVTIAPYPSFSLTLNATNTTCNGTTDGSASVVTFGGSAPFSYLWNTGQTTSTINNLTPGTYQVTVTDGNGCTETGSTMVELGSGLNVVVNADTFICLNSSGTATAMAFGGDPSTYLYFWSTGATTQTVNDLAVGEYFVTVTTPQGCSGTTSIVFVNGGTFSVNSSFQNVKCYGDSTGSISLNTTGGIAPYSFLWSNGATTSTIQNIPVGNYAVTVSDQSECEKYFDFDIDEPNELIVEAIGTDGTCGNLGSADSDVTGGLMPYFYQWSNGATTPSISILGPNTYTLTVTDSNNCTAEDDTTIELISSVACGIELVQPITSPGGNNGSLSANITDGVGPFTFLWNNGKTTQTINNLFAGSYSVTVTDSNDCVSTCNFFLLDGAQIGDRVWEDINENGIQENGEEGLAGVDIELNGIDDYGNNLTINTSSNSNGNYLFNIPPGDYQLTFFVPNGYVPSPQSQGADNTTDSDADPLTNETPIIPINPGIENHNIDAGFYVEINCDNVTDAGSICCDQILCGSGNEALPITNSASPTGGFGTLEFVWMYSETTSSFDPQTWIIIDNSNFPVYSPGVIDTSTYLIRRVRREGCSQFFESNIVEIAVNEIPQPTISIPEVICINSVAEAIGSDFGPDADHTWFFENGNPSTSSSPTVSDISWNNVGTFEVSYTVEINGCQAIILDSLEVSDSPDYCGYELILNGEKIDTTTVLLEWLYPDSDTVDRNYSVEWAWENEPFSTIGIEDSIQMIGNFIHHFKSHGGMLVGKNYYRVVLDDSDGTQLISNVIEFERDSIPIIDPEKPYRLVHSYPNPFSDVIYIDVYDRFDVPLTIELFNTLGQMIHFEELTTEKDHFEIQTKEYPSGTYFMFVRYAGKPQKIFKFIKGK